MVASPEVVRQTIAVFEQAAAANRHTPARQGNLVALTSAAATDVMICADLHGNRLHFEALLRAAALDEHPGRHLLMQEVCHGGPSYPGGNGCMSHLLLEDVAALKVAYPQRFHFLLSNHEWAELTDFPITKANRMLNLNFRSGLQQMYGDDAERVREAYLAFLATCPLAARLDNGVFACHSAPEKVDREGFHADVLDHPLSVEDLAPHGEVFRLLWGRDFRAENAAAFARLVHADVLVHGHEPCLTGYQVPNPHQIILDCCGPSACYLLLPLGRRLNQQEVMDCIRELT